MTTLFNEHYSLHVSILESHLMSIDRFLRHYSVLLNDDSFNPIIDDFFGHNLQRRKPTNITTTGGFFKLENEQGVFKHMPSLEQTAQIWHGRSIWPNLNPLRLVVCFSEAWGRHRACALSNLKIPVVKGKLKEPIGVQR